MNMLIAMQYSRMIECALLKNDQARAVELVALAFQAAADQDAAESMDVNTSLIHVLPAKIADLLGRHNVNTVADLSRYTDHELGRMVGISERYLEEISRVRKKAQAD
jgi:hypothetical protein